VQFTDSLERSRLAAQAQGETASAGAAAPHPGAEGIAGVPPAVIETVTSLANAIDDKDHFTRGHSRKVAAYSEILCRALGLSEAETEEICLAGMLHDIGKVGIPEPLLNKGGALNAEEWELMKTHTELGARILEPLQSIGKIRSIVRHHHEYFDGSGYPDGLAGEQIPAGARIVTIADAFDTITSERTYKKRRTPEDALRELERCAGTQFDPELIRVFVAAMRQRDNMLVAVGSSPRAPGDPAPVPLSAGRSEGAEPSVL
jgi:putative nucleotidyltransferase with HDIG domain